MSVDAFDKQPVETWTTGVDFVDRLPVGASVSSGVVSAVDLAGTDVTSIVLSGSVATISGTQALIRVKAGTHGIDYRIKFVVTLTNADVREKDLLMQVGNQ